MLNIFWLLSNSSWEILGNFSILDHLKNLFMGESVQIVETTKRDVQITKTVKKERIVP